MRLRKEWTTHIPMLIKYVQLTDKPVLELGTGLFSTPLLHWLCKEEGVKLKSYESVSKYYDFAKKFTSKGHSIGLVKDWNEIENNDNHWGVVFVDHTLERRWLDIIKFSERADYIIVHDSDKIETYKYDKVFPLFKYRYDWKACKPWTTVLSNFKPL